MAFLFCCGFCPLGRGSIAFYLRSKEVEQNFRGEFALELASYMYWLMRHDQIGLNPFSPRWPFPDTMERFIDNCPMQDFRNQCE